MLDNSFSASEKELDRAAWDCHARTRAWLSTHASTRASRSLSPKEKRLLERALVSLTLISKSSIERRRPIIGNANAALLGKDTSPREQGRIRVDNKLMMSFTKPVSNPGNHRQISPVLNLSSQRWGDMNEFGRFQTPTNSKVDFICKEA